MRLAGKVAIVTGASRGIGKAIAKAFAREGAAVGLIARSGLEEAAAEVGGRFAWAVADVADSRAVDVAAQALRAALGPADLVVNNAGNVVRGPTRELSDEDWRSVLSVNLDGTFYVTRAFLDDVIARRGRIINISSIAGRQGTPELAAYNAAKHGVVGLTRSLAEELRDRGVQVNAIYPRQSPSSRSVRAPRRPATRLRSEDRSPSGPSPRPPCRTPAGESCRSTSGRPTVSAVLSRRHVAVGPPRLLFLRRLPGGQQY